MARRPRLKVPGIVHHATLNGVNGEYVFLTDEDRAGYLSMLAATVRRYRWRCLAYCLMGTHVHLLVQTPEVTFPDGMRWLHGHYGRCFNKQHDRKGHLFKGRYHDVPVLTSSHLIRVAGYIAVNPVDAGICRDPAEWRWSSHARVATGAAPAWLAHDRLVEMLDAPLGPNAYERIVAAAWSEL